jgi:hypothetical protein
MEEVTLDEDALSSLLIFECKIDNCVIGDHPSRLADSNNVLPVDVEEPEGIEMQLSGRFAEDANENQRLPSEGYDREERSYDNEIPARKKIEKQKRPSRRVGKDKGSTTFRKTDVSKEDKLNRSAVEDGNQGIFDIS